METSGLLLVSVFCNMQRTPQFGDKDTIFFLDGIQRLVRVTDTEGNVTPPFTYDPLGNVLTKQTANMAEKGKMIAYTYDYHRLTGISYPDHPENNVKYYITV